MVPKRIGERLLAAMSDVIVPVSPWSTVAVFEAMPLRAPGLDQQRDLRAVAQGVRQDEHAVGVAGTAQ